jgi:hypothetical protein
MMYAKE